MWNPLEDFLHLFLSHTIPFPFLSLCLSTNSPPPTPRAYDDETDVVLETISSVRHVGLKFLLSECDTSDHFIEEEVRTFEIM